MDWIRLVAGILVSSIATWFFAVQKSSKDADVKIAVLEDEVRNAKDILESFKQESRESTRAVLGDMKEASRELHTAVTAIRAMADSQAVVNMMSAKTLDVVVGKVDKNSEDIAGMKSTLYDVVRSVHNVSHP